MDDTIVAISTALGVGAISIVRVSGIDALEIVNKIFKGKDLTKVGDHTINYGHIIDNNKIIDEVMVSVMLAPKTYTKENIVEINSHGGIASTNKILKLLLHNGCRLANPGEFTERAFLNGRINLLESESIMDIIHATNEKALELAVNQLSGNISNEIKSIYNSEIEIISNIEVNIDYPEYDDIEVLTNKKILPKLLKIEEHLKNLIVGANESQIIKNGIDTIIIGKPNVGKSSILNKLLNEEKAIVTDIPGTTRDIVEGVVDINGIRLNIIDTAGIRKTDDIVESIGVNKSIELIDKADLIIFVLNNNEEITKEEIELLEKIRNKNYILVVNKIDLENRLKINEDYIELSTLNNIGIEKLKEKIIELFNLEKIENKDLNYLSSARSIDLIQKSLDKLNNCIEAIKNNYPIDMVEIDLKESSQYLSEILGINYNEDLLDQLFSNFCLGK